MFLVTDKLMMVITKPESSTPKVSGADLELHAAELKAFRSDVKVFHRKIGTFLADLAAQAEYLASFEERLGQACEEGR